MPPPLPPPPPPPPPLLLPVSPAPALAAAAAPPPPPEAPSDEDILIQLATAWRYEFLGANTWNSRFPLADWFGVDTDESGKSVTSLSLDGAGIQGQLPPALGLLRSLTSLSLYNNSLTGGIPSELGNLQNLTYLVLSHNQLSGSTPASLGSLPELSELGVSRNMISGSLPRELGNLFKLQTLDVSGNGISGSLPREVGNLVNLGTLDMRSNGISGRLPPEIGNLVNLTILGLSNNRMSGSLPRELGNLVNLQSLHLCGNFFSGNILLEIGALTNLEFLCLAQNSFSGSIPRTLGNLTRLSEMFLEQNQLSGSIPVELGNLVSLQYLDISNNRISGSVPAEIRNLVHLQHLVIANNLIGGPLSADIVSFGNASRLVFANNAFSGSIPKEIGTLTNLEILDFSGNGINGTLPEELGKLVKCTVLNLANNMVSGSIPASLGNLSSLSDLRLYQNSLDGTIPEELGNLANLEYLSFSENMLSGSIPLSLGNLSLLSELKLFRNALNGTIPSEMGNLVSLQSLMLHHNSLNGSIPEVVGDLQNLHYLALSGNLLSGSIPHTVSTLTALQDLKLHVNSLDGSIPSGISGMANLETLSLGVNSLSGSIPREISTLTKLKGMKTYYNQLTGSFPAEITNLASLTYLSLRNNRLVGTLPSSLTRMSKLTALYLDGNELTGPIPDLPRSLKVLDLSGNYFTSGGCFNYSGLSKDLSGNCLLDKNCSQQQQTAESCQQFCNTTAPSGACAGQGTCSLDFFAGQAVCTCNANYARSPNNPGTCVRLSSLGSPPPPPTSIAENNYTQGVSFLSTPMLSLNRWSRYLSLNFYASTGGSVWLVATASSWMSPRSLFLGASSATTSATTGTLSWPPLREQGTCASCWAMAAADAVGASVTISSSQGGGNVTALSAYQIVACSNSSGGCLGDFPTNALDYAAQNRLQRDEAYLTSPNCSSQGSLSPQVVMYEAIQFRAWLGLLLTLQRQPAIVILQGSDPSFQQPVCTTRGSFGDPSCYTGSLDHSVLVIGYDLSANVPYWVIRNSWGPAWCLGGFMRISIQGDNGVCGMNVLPAYYPISAPLPGDPCYTKSTVPDGFVMRLPALNPCGGGKCSAFPAWGPYSYICDCQTSPSGFMLPGFVAVNNTVPVTLPGAGLGITQTCAPVDACSFSGSTHPCEVGTCVNDNRGGYSCICPLGYFQSSLADGSPTCSLGETNETSSWNYTVDPGVNCRLIAATYNITLYQLQALNEFLDCTQDPLPVGTVVDVSNSNYQCQIPYITSFTDRTCKDVEARLNPSVTASTLERLNAGSDCSALAKGQLLCLRGGEWQPPPMCTTFFSANSSNPCEALQKTDIFADDPALFFALNPGIICDPPGTLTMGASLNTENFLQVCIQSNPIGTTTCPKGYKLITLKAKDTCNSLAKFCKKDRRKLEALNKLRSGFTCNKIKAKSLFCC